MDLAAEARARLFKELGPPPQNTHEIYGSASDHCAICPERRFDRCTKTCTEERKKLDATDGVSVSV
jgi:hypothetical protein